MLENKTFFGRTVLYSCAARDHTEVNTLHLKYHTFQQQIHESIKISRMQKVQYILHLIKANKYISEVNN